MSNTVQQLAEKTICHSMNLSGQYASGGAVKPAIKIWRGVYETFDIQ
jgi:hypothetical protein